MREQPRTRLGTISILIALIPFVALVCWFVIHPPCGTLLRSSIENIVVWGRVFSFPFSIVALWRDRPKRRAVVGLALSSIPLIAFVALVTAMVYAIATGSTGIPGAIEIRSSPPGGPASVDPGVSIRTETQYYDIRGSSEEELRAQMVSLGPHGYAAYTAPSVQWNYAFTEHDGMCSIRSVRVDTLITFTYPRWTNEGSDQALADLWRRNLAALENHEKGHEETTRRASQAIYDSLHAFPAYPSCAELKQAANARAELILKEAAEQDREYDRGTDHGRARTEESL